MVPFEGVNADDVRVTVAAVAARGEANSSWTKIDSDDPSKRME